MDIKLQFYIIHWHCYISDFLVCLVNIKSYGKVSTLTQLPLLRVLFIDKFNYTNAIGVLHNLCST